MCDHPLNSLQRGMTLPSEAPALPPLPQEKTYLPLHIFIWASCSAYSVTSFSGTMYLSENFLIASLSPLTSLLSSNNGLIWARGWRSRPAHGRWWGLHSKRDNGSLVACHRRDIVVELEVELLVVSSFSQNLHSWPFLSWHAVMREILPVSYFHFRLLLDEVGGGSDSFV